MSKLRELKKKLTKLKQYKSNLPALIDLSEVYGDGYYTKEDLSDVENMINEVEKEIETLKQ